MSYLNTKHNIKELRRVDPDAARRLIKKTKRKKSKQKRQIEKASLSVLDKEKLYDDGCDNNRQNGDSSLLTASSSDYELPEEIEIEYVAQSVDDIIQEYENDLASSTSITTGSLLDDYRHVLERFQIDEEDDTGDDEMGENVNNASVGKSLLERGDDSDEGEDDESSAPKVSKKIAKVKNRPTVAALKQFTNHPDLVEVWDVTSPDPYMLISLKSYRNSIPVPLHWSYKRKYLQGKKGIEKSPFKLPEFIEATKISEIRQVLQEKEQLKTLKQKMREKVRPKMHKMDIDYQTLHDAFFKYATKPVMTGFGEVYYEGRELEAKMKHFVPSKPLTPRLREALGMETDLYPPPWIFNMQRYGPPPSYPGVVFAGVNSNIPNGAIHGFHPGGWGNRPVDSYGNFLYGNLSDHNSSSVFSTGGINQDIDTNKLWGEETIDDESETESMADMTEEEAVAGMETPIASSITGTITPMDGMDSVVSGLQSIESLGGTVSFASTGLDTPESVDLRRRALNAPTPKPYTVLTEQKAPAQPGALFKSSTVYEIPDVKMPAPPPPPPRSAPGLPPGGAVTPFGLGGMVTPLGINGGSITPLMVPVGGSDQAALPGGPSDITVALNPSDIEQEGVFAGDVIRHQLKMHEEARQKTLKAAGHSEFKISETKAKVRKDKTKTKKEKGFKF